MNEDDVYFVRIHISISWILMMMETYCAKPSYGLADLIYNLMSYNDVSSLDDGPHLQWRFHEIVMELENSNHLVML